MRIDLRWVGTRSGIIGLTFLILVGYLFRDVHSNASGISGTTQKPGVKNPIVGCSCHCLTPEDLTRVAIIASNGDTSFISGKTYQMQVSVSNPNEVAAGVDVAAFKGKLGVISQSGLRSLSGELTHNTAKTLMRGSATWTFNYSVPNGVGSDTIYATGNAVNSDGSEDNDACIDGWNWAPKFIVNIVSSGVADRVDHLAIDPLTIAPNPTAGLTKLTVKASEAGKLHVEIVSVSGRRALEFETREIAPGSNTFDLPTHGLSNGEYIIRAIDSQGSEVGAAKLIVKR